jgi:hypothetical protein
MDCNSFKIDFSIGTSQQNIGYVELFENPSMCECDTTEDKGIAGRVLCLLSVPSYMIPGDIIQYFKSFVDAVVSIDIVMRRDVSQQFADCASPFFAIIIMRTANLASQLVSEFHGSWITTTLEPTKCLLLPIKSIVVKRESEEGFKTFASSSNSMSIKGDLCFVRPLLQKNLSGCTQHIAEDLTTLLLYDGCCLSPDVTDQALLSAPPHHQHMRSSVVSPTDNHCPLCLEPIECWSDHRQFGMKPHITTYCNHTFHLNCASNLSTSSAQTSGNDASARCPVCRFVHDGDQNYGVQLGGFTRRNGDVSVSSSQCMVCHLVANSSPIKVPVNEANNNASVWCCLICGFLGCDIYHNNHILHHYNETLHTYAINTSNGHVWDFAGGGYVDRLASYYGDSDAEVTNALDTAALVTTNKLVEVEPQYHVRGISDFRSHLPNNILSDEDEKWVVNCELANAAKEFKKIYLLQVCCQFYLSYACYIYYFIAL